MSIIDNYKKVKNFTNLGNNLNLVVFYIYRPLGFFFSALILNTQIKPNQVTVFKYFIALISLSILLASDLNDVNFLIGFLLYFFCDILDYVDGSLARAKKLTSKFGRIIDTVSDHFFSTIFLFLITLKIESKLHLYFLVVFLAISWSQVYINTLIKFYKKKIIPKTDPKSLEAKKKIDLDLNISSVKKIINKCLNLVTFISINLNLITLYIFIFFDLLYEYLFFFFICNSFLITCNLILILKNNFKFLSTEDNE